MSVKPSAFRRGATYRRISHDALVDYLIRTGWALHFTEKRGIQWFTHPSYPAIDEDPPERRRRAYAMVPPEVHRNEIASRNAIVVAPQSFGDYFTVLQNVVHDLELYEDRWKGFILADMIDGHRCEYRYCAPGHERCFERRDFHDSSTDHQFHDAPNDCAHSRARAAETRD